MANQQDELNSALMRLETKHRFYNYLVSIGAGLEAANLIANSADELKRVSWDGVLFKFRGSDVPAVDDDAAKDYFLKGPFATLFVNAKQSGGDSHLQLDPALVDSARSGNWTAKGALLRSLNGNEQARSPILWWMARRRVCAKRFSICRRLWPPHRGRYATRYGWSSTSPTWTAIGLW